VSGPLPTDRNQTPPTNTTNAAPIQEKKTRCLSEESGRGSQGCPARPLQLFTSYPAGVLAAARKLPMHINTANSNKAAPATLNRSECCRSALTDVTHPRSSTRAYRRLGQADVASRMSGRFEHQREQEGSNRLGSRHFCSVACSFNPPWAEGGQLGEGMARIQVPKVPVALGGNGWHRKSKGSRTRPTVLRHGPYTRLGRWVVIENGCSLFEMRQVHIVR
jgi:hypothetical protein